MKKIFIVFILMFLGLTLLGCNEENSIEKFDFKIGEDGYLYINGENTGIRSEPGKDGIDGSDGKSAYEIAVEQGYSGTAKDWIESLVGTSGKSAYEIAVEQGYTGTVDEWISSITDKSGKLNVYDDQFNEYIESEIKVVNGKLLLTTKKTETVVTEYGTLNEIALENKTYKEVFEDGNYSPVNMNTKESQKVSYSDYSGKTSIVNDSYVTAPSSLYVTGEVSQQMKSNIALTGDFYIASKIKCTRYESGYLGVVFGTDSKRYQDTTMDFEYDEFSTFSSIQTLDNEYVFIGSCISANLDGYIDDTVIVDVSLFEETPTRVMLDNCYERYIKIVNGEIDPETYSEEVVTEKSFYLADQTMKYSDYKAKSTFMAYMNSKAYEIGMTKTKFVDAAGFYNTTTAYDLLKMGVYACSYDDLCEAWHKNEYVVSVNGPKARNVALTTTVAGSALENYYFLFGGKTGTVDGQINLLAIVEGDDNKLFAVVVLGCDDNRFEAAKQTMDIAMMKYRNPSLDVSGYDVPCKSAAVCEVPPYNTKGYTDYKLNILYGKDIYSVRTPASITKVMTSICMLDFVSDINESFTIIETDITSGSGNYFYAGDVLTFKEALHAMMLPSSNTCAEATATAAGHKILEYSSR